MPELIKLTRSEALALYRRDYARHMAAKARASQAKRDADRELARYVADQVDKARRYQRNHRRR